MVLGKQHVISNKLHSLCVHDRKVLTLDHALGEMLMDEATECAPFVAVKHNKQMVSFCDEIVRDVGWWSMAIDIALLVHGALDNTAIRDDGHRSAA